MNLRRNERCRVTVLVASLGLSQLCLFGCEDENGPAACSGPPVVEAFLASPSGPAVGDIIVEGTAEHDFAIRNVRVAGVEAGLAGDRRELVPGADGQAVVAAIDAIAHGAAEFARDRRFRFDGEIGNAATRIELIRSREGARRANVEAGGA